MKKMAAFMAAVMLAAALAGCGSGQEGRQAYVESVSTICGFGSVGMVERFAGVVMAGGETKVEKDAGQTVAQIYVEEGQTVEKGQVLFAYDGTEIQLNLEKARLELQQLNNTLAAKQAEKKQLEAEKASAGADQQLAYTLEIQEADAAILETNYNISLKAKEVERLENSSTNLEVKSPVEGCVKSINANGSTDNYGNELPFMVISNVGEYRVKGYVNENNAAQLSEGAMVLLRSRVDESIWTGTVSTIDWENPEQTGGDYYYNSSDTTSSSKYAFYVALDSSEGLMLGQHLYIEPDYGQQTATGQGLALPAWYINDLESDPWVWAQSSKGKLEKRSVRLGEHDEMFDTYQIEEGLSAEDYIAYPDEALAVGMGCTTYYEDSIYAVGVEGDGGDVDDQYGIDAMDGGEPAGLDEGAADVNPEDVE